MEKELLKNLIKERNKLDNEIYKIEKEEIEKKQKPRLKKMIGQCFVYRDNNFGKNSGYWDVFRRILDWVDTKEKGFNFIYEEIQINSEGGINWDIATDMPYLNKEWWDADCPFYGYEKITNDEYNRAKESFLEEINTQKTLRKWLKEKY